MTIAGCDSTVPPPVGVDEPFSIYGIINPRRTTQTLLVAPTRRELRDYEDVVDATVTSRELETVEVVTWTDSVARGERGERAHVFTAPFLPPFGSDYEIRVVRSDGRATQATAHVPGRVDVGSETDSYNQLSIMVTGEDDFLLHQFDVVYEWQAYLKHGPRCEADSLFLSHGRDREYIVNYKPDAVRMAGGYRVDVDLAFDHLELERLNIGDPARAGIGLKGIRVRLIVAEPAWDPPGGTFDANTLADPTAMTNTTNGFGLVVGGYNHEHGVFPSREAIVNSRFLDGFVRPPRTDCALYCTCMGWEY